MAASANIKITEADIRIFMMDRPELNPLLRGVRFDATDIEQAQIHVVDYYNMASPPIDQVHTVETFPFRWLMLTGVAGHLLRGAALNQASNNLNYSLDGVQVNDQDKAEIFARLGSDLWLEFKEEVQKVKLNQNVAAAYGMVYSEHRRLAR